MPFPSSLVLVLFSESSSHTPQLFGSAFPPNAPCSSLISRSSRFLSRSFPSPRSPPFPSSSVIKKGKAETLASPLTEVWHLLEYPSKPRRAPLVRSSPDLIFASPFSGTQIYTAISCRRTALNGESWNLFPASTVSTGFSKDHLDVFFLLFHQKFFLVRKSFYVPFFL